MKKLLTILATLVAFYFIVPAVLPLSAKQALYANLTDFEASMLGFEQAEADIGEMKVAYYTNATADDTRPAMLLLHGYSADKDAWPRFAKNLNENFQIIIPDMAGHGDTGFNKDWSYSGPAQAERILKLMDALGVQKVHVVGNSMGGFISAHFALQYPDRTLSATLMDPAGVISPTPSKMDSMLEKGRNPFEINNREEFDEFFAMTMAKPPWIPGILLDAAAEKYQTRKEELRQIVADFRYKDMLDKELPNIKTPVLLLWGEEDQLIHVSSVKVWEASLPNIKTKVWSGIGHLPMMEIPEESANVVAQFIQKL